MKIHIVPFHNFFLLFYFLGHQVRSFPLAGFCAARRCSMSSCDWLRRRGARGLCLLRFATVKRERETLIERAAAAAAVGPPPLFGPIALSAFLHVSCSLSVLDCHSMEPRLSNRLFLREQRRRRRRRGQSVEARERTRHRRRRPMTIIDLLIDFLSPCRALLSPRLSPLVLPRPVDDLRVCTLCRSCRARKQSQPFLARVALPVFFRSEQSKQESERAAAAAAPSSCPNHAAVPALASPAPGSDFDPEQSDVCGLVLDLE